MSKNITTADSIRNLAAEVKKGFVKKEAFAPHPERCGKGHQVSGCDRQPHQLLHQHRQDR